MPYPRKPRFRRTGDPTKIELTERDQTIIRVVHRYRFLRSSHITDLLGGSRQQILRRLQQLFHHGYLERPLCQLDYFQGGGSRSMIYGLGSRGAAFLRRQENIPFSKLDWSQKNQSIKKIFLNHALMVSDILVSFELACRKRGNLRLLLGDEMPLPEAIRKLPRPFRWEVTGSEKEKVGVVPDAVFTLESIAESKRILYFLEADCGTMPITRSKRGGSCIMRKLEAYSQTWKLGIHRSRFNASRVRVLFVTPNQERSENIRKAISSVVVGQGIFLQTPLDKNFPNQTILELE